MTGRDQSSVERRKHLFRATGGIGTDRSEWIGTFEIFGDVTKTPLPGVANPSDPRFVTLAAPVAVFGGIRIRL
jgi:hypothetical protein